MQPFPVVGWLVVPLMVLGPLLLVPLAVYAWRHAEDGERFAAGIGSGLSPAGRRLAAAFSVVVAVAGFLAGVSLAVAR